MKPDFYTKAVLTVIAIALSVIACKPLINPDTTASAQSGAFPGVQFSGSVQGVFYLFDSRTGDVWLYGGTDDGLTMRKYHYKVSALGGPAALSPVK